MGSKAQEEVIDFIDKLAPGIWAVINRYDRDPDRFKVRELMLEEIRLVIYDLLLPHSGA